ncbi:hypothetical protein [Haloechinothrix salitolerans]|uniref:Uncharacterized protein n=1 Tax=Haloechinothrix salitolerans TaxID=926830 RepID=A0ABW2C686_9PSEU
MLLAKKTWWVVTLVLTGAVAGTIAVTTAFVPGVDDIKDPLGRPSGLAKEVIFSASEFDRLTGILVPKHSELSERIGVLNGVATELAAVVDEAGTLAPVSAQINSDTDDVVNIADPLPRRIGDVTERAEQANATVSALGQSVGSVTYELRRVLAAQKVVYGSLQTLGPRAEEIRKTLQEIEKSSEHVAPFSPLIQLLSEVDTTGLSVLGGGR